MVPNKSPSLKLSLFATSDIIGHMTTTIGFVIYGFLYMWPIRNNRLSRTVFEILSFKYTYIKKTAVSNTLLTMTIVSDVENSKNLAYDIVTRKFPIISLQCHDVLTL